MYSVCWLIDRLENAGDDKKKKRKKKTIMGTEGCLSNINKCNI